MDGLCFSRYCENAEQCEDASTSSKLLLSWRVLGSETEAG